MQLVPIGSCSCLDRSLFDLLEKWAHTRLNTARARFNLENARLGLTRARLGFATSIIAAVATVIAAAIAIAISVATVATTYLLRNEVFEGTPHKLAEP